MKYNIKVGEKLRPANDAESTRGILEARTPMPDREQAIKALQVIADLKMDYPDEMPAEYMSVGGFPLYRKLARDSLVLLREQEPVKPKRFLVALPDWYNCGVCGADMLDTGDGYRPKYCPQCGRAVKWDG